MKKGVSTIIATILLLLVVIAIVGYSFGFFQSFFGQATSTGTEQLESVQGTLQQAAGIETATSNGFVIRNTGTASLTLSQLGVFVNNAPVSCSLWSTPTNNTTITNVTSRGFANCTFVGATCTSGATLRVTTPGLSDTFTC